MIADIIIEYLGKLIAYITQHKKRFFLSLVVGICVVAVIIVWRSFALVVITVDDKTNTSGTVTYFHDNTASPIYTIGNLAFIPHDTRSIIAQKTEYIQTETPTNIPWYNMTSVTIPLVNDKNATKVSYASTLSNPCVTYNQSSDSLLSYSCTEPITLIRHDTSGEYWKNTPVGTMQLLPISSTAYGGGVLGFSGSFDAAKVLNYYDGQGNVTSWNAPSTANISSFNQSKIVVDASNPDDKHFIVVTVEGDIYLASPEGSHVTYTHFKAPSDYDPGHQRTECSISSGSIYCYRGNILGELGDKDDKKAIRPTISIIDSFTSKTMKTSVVDQKYLDSICATSGGRLYGVQSNVVYALERSGESFRSRTISTDTSRITCGSDLFFIQNNGISRFDGHNSYRAFYSPNIIPKSIYIHGGSVYVLGSIPDIQGTTFAYLLDQTADTTPGKRLIDLYPNTKLTDLTGQDMVNDKLYGSVSINAYTVNEFPDREQRARVNMRSLGIDVDNVDVHIVY